MIKTLFTLVGILLLAVGVLHLSVLVTTPPEPGALVPVIVLVLLGLAYLAVGVLLLLRRESALLAGMILPAVGLLITLTLLASSPLLAAFIALAILALAGSAYLYFQSRATIRRVR